MLRRILVPLDTSEYTVAATRTGAEMACRGSEGVKAADGVTITGLGLVDLDQLPVGRFASLVPREKILAEAQETVRGLVEDFRKTAREVGVKDDRVQTRQAVGSPFREIIRESVFNDLIVLGEQCSFPPVQHDYQTLHNLYHEASRPLLLTRKDFHKVDTVVLAMDGTAPASRMMYTFVHLRPFAGARIVMTYSQVEESMYGLKDYFSRVAAFLEDYGLKVTRRPMPGELEEDIPAVVRDEGAQVLAVGIHRTQFMDRIRDPLELRPHIARRLLESVSASLFVVH